MMNDFHLSLEDMLYSYVFPVVLFRRTDEIAFQPVAAVGTGFTLGEGTFITCWHCVSGDLKEDEYYGIPYGDDMSLPNQVATLVQHSSRITSCRLSGGINQNRDSAHAACGRFASVLGT